MVLFGVSVLLFVLYPGLVGELGAGLVKSYLEHFDSTPSPCAILNFMNLQCRMIETALSA
jgi:hypothetical protein